MKIEILVNNNNHMTVMEILHNFDMERGHYTRPSRNGVLITRSIDMGDVMESHKLTGAMTKLEKHKILFEVKPCKNKSHLSI